MQVNLRKVRKYLFVICLFGIIFSAVSLFYVQRVLPNSQIREIQYCSKNQKIDALIYEPHQGPNGNPEEERPLIVLVHGFAMTKEFMLSFSIELARRGVSTISITMPGHGMSESPYYFTNHSRFAARDAIDYMLNYSKYSINISRIGIIGHSMGAMTAIKTASMDQRIISTIALASPNGNSSSSLLPNEKYDLSYLNESIAAYTNITTPHNLFFGVGNIDELVSVEEGEEIVATASGVERESFAIGKIYNPDFKEGGARLLKTYQNADHLTEVYDTRIIQDCLNWLALSFQMDPESFLSSQEMPYISWYRLILGGTGLVSSFLLFLPLTSYGKFLFPRNNKEDESVESKKLDQKSLESSERHFNQDFLSYIFYILFIGIIPGILGSSLDLSLPIMASFIVSNAFPQILLSGIFGIGFIFALNHTRFKDDIPKIKKSMNTPKIKTNALFLLFLLFCFSVLVLLIFYFWTESLFSLWLSSERLFSLFLSIIMVSPLMFSHELFLKRKTPHLGEETITFVFSYIKQSFISSMILGVSITFSIGISLGFPLMSSFLEGFIVFGLIFVMVIFIFDLFYINWIHLLSKKPIISSFVLAILFSIVFNVGFPITR